MFHTMRLLSNHWRIRMIHRWCKWFNYFNQLLWACSEGYYQPHCRSHLSSLPAGVPYFESKFRLEKITLFIVMLQTEVKLLCINSCTFFSFHCMSYIYQISRLLYDCYGFTNVLSRFVLSGTWEALDKCLLNERNTNSMYPK